MTYEQIETFLAVISCGNISSAANVLFVSQSTVSSRLQLLEEELGIKLILRRKGYKSIELTPYGSTFIAIATQWIALWKDTQNLKNMEDTKMLSIASVDAVNNFTLLPLLNGFIDKFPNIKLSIKTHHSEEIHGLVENNIADIGFVFSQVQFQNIISKPIYRELMYLICHKDSDYYDNINPCELNPQNEIFLRWGLDYQRWHDRYFDIKNLPLINVNTGSMLQHYLNIPNRWAIAPMSVVKAFRNNPNIVFYSLSDPPTPRICYQITNRYPKSSHTSTIKIFENELDKYIDTNSDICRFEAWMLE